MSLFASGWLLNRGSITIGTAFLLFQYGLALRRPLEELVDQFGTVQKANGAMKRVADLLSLQSTISDDGVQSPAAGPLSLTFDDVSFEYPGEDDSGDRERVIHHLSFTIEPGNSVGVVGRSGSGKTTLARLVLRLIEPTHGTIRLGGVAMSDVSTRELRRRIAMIPQDVQLVAGSIRDNVTLFDPCPSDAEVEDALAKVGLVKLLEAGIHTKIGAGELGLSAGQAQLLALARVWLRNPDIVVLDEATSRVDPETEDRLAHAINVLLEGRTAVVIAHRLTTLHSVDQIMVMADGEIVEFGDREILAAQSDGDPAGESAYRRLLELALTGEPS